MINDKNTPMDLRSLSLHLQHGGRTESIWHVIAVLNAFAAIGAVYRFLARPGHEVGGPVDAIGLSIASAYVLFTVGSWVVTKGVTVEISQSNRRATRISFWCLGNLLFVTALYCATLNPESDIFLYYFIPLIGSALYLGTKGQFLTFIGAFLGMLISMVFIVSHPELGDGVRPRRALSQAELVTHVVAIRAFSLLLPTLPVMLLSQFVKESWRPWRQNFFLAITRAIPEVMFIKDPQKRFVWVSPGFCEFVKRDADEIEGQDDFKFFNKEHATQFQIDDNEVLAGRSDCIKKEEENQLLRANGATTSRQVYVTKVPIKGDDGRIEGIVGTILDVTTQKEKQRRLFRWFVHDFPKPIDVIRNRIIPEIEQCLESSDWHSPSSRRNVKLRLDKIGSLLQFTLGCGRAYGFLSGGRGDTWQIDRQRPFSCETIVDCVFETLAPQCSNIRFIKQVAKEKIYSDAEKLMSMLYLLITNSISAVNRRFNPEDPAKRPDFTQAPQIDVVVSCSAEELTIKVLDNGDGISRGDIDVIFDEGISRFGSSGFGLYIVREFASLGGGRAWVSCAERKGGGAELSVKVTKFELRGNRADQTV